jgi:hypothetical protein
MSGLLAIVKAEDAADVNARLGRDTFNAANGVESGGQITHMIAHAWDTPSSDFRATIEAMIGDGYDIRTEDVADGERPKAKAQTLASSFTMAWPPSLDGNWLEGLPQVLDERDFGGTMWRALEPNLTWGPDAYPQGWERVTPLPAGQWAPGISVTVGEEYAYDGTTYRVVQGHTTQAGWEPPNVPALWAVV